MVHSQVGDHDSALQLLDVKVRGRTLGAENIDILVVSGEFCNLDLNGFKVAEQRPREISHEVPNVVNPIVKFAVVHKKNK